MRRCIVKHRQLRARLYSSPMGYLPMRRPVQVTKTVAGMIPRDAVACCRSVLLRDVHWIPPTADPTQQYALSSINNPHPPARSYRKFTIWDNFMDLYQSRSRNEHETPDFAWPYAYSGLSRTALLGAAWDVGCERSGE